MPATGLLILKTADEILRQQKTEQQRRDANTQATIKTAKKDYPNETWLPASAIRLRYVKLPKNLENIYIGKSKFPLNKDDERILLKEVKQAGVLTEDRWTVLKPGSGSQESRTIMYS